MGYGSWETGREKTTLDHLSRFMVYGTHIWRGYWRIRLGRYLWDLMAPKGNQSWIFIGRTDAEAETPLLWPLDVKNWLTGKAPDAGKDWRQEEKGMTEDEMVGWHHWLNGHEFEQALGVGDGQGGLACYSPWCCKELTQLSDWAEKAVGPTLIQEEVPGGGNRPQNRGTNLGVIGHRATWKK